MGRKHCGKKRNCLLQAISPFPTVFSKDLYSKQVTNLGLFGKELNVTKYKVQNIIGKGEMLVTRIVTNLSKFKAFEDDNFNVAEMAKFVFDRVEKNAGKGENAGYQHFLLFPQCFPKASF